MHAAPGDGRVGAGEVDVLEDATLGCRLGEPVRAQAVLVDHEHLAGLDLAHDAGADGGQRGVLARHHPAAVEPAQDQRPDALRVAGGVQGVLVHPDEGERALELGQHLEGAQLEGGVGVVGQQRRHQAGVVGRRLRLLAVQLELVGRTGQVRDHLGQLMGVDQVAVVAQGDRAQRCGLEGRLGVLPGAGTGRGVARVPDRQVALEGVERGLVEHLRDQAHVLVDQDLAAVAHRDAGRLLAAVLQGVQAEVGELGDVLAGGPDAEDATGVLRALVVRVESRRQTAVSAQARSVGWGHGRESTARRGSPRTDQAHSAVIPVT